MMSNSNSIRITGVWDSGVLKCYCDDVALVSVRCSYGDGGGASDSDDDLHARNGDRDSSNESASENVDVILSVLLKNSYRSFLLLRRHHRFPSFHG